LDYAQVDFDDRPADAELEARLNKLLKTRDPTYAMVVVDLSEPQALRWAGLRPDSRQNPGSVGKIVCMLALFDALAGAFPDVVDRARILRDAMVPAGDWVDGDSHVVPRYDPATGKNGSGLLRSADTFRLSEWLDHAISASANGAGTVVWREAMLIRHFGAAYPIDEQTREAFFKDTSKTVLSALARAVIVEPLVAAGLDPQMLIQGSFWTQTSKRYVPGGQSFATPRELARYMLRMEQGRLVDPWSSLEIKKYLYVTKRRYRYIYAPELASSATFFKSGSLYQCMQEEGFRCAKYMGNVRNMMNSVTEVETADENPRRYIVALMSNVLRVNSAWDHSRIAAAVHEMIVHDRQVQLRETAADKELIEVGRSD
jgi:hypothetical protein